MGHSGVDRRYHRWAAMLLVAAREDPNSSAPQVTVVR